MIMNSLRIRELRKEREEKQQTIARYLNCSQVCYSRYETGEREIPLSALIKLADYYHTSIDYLLDLTDEIQPYPRKKEK